MIGTLAALRIDLVGTTADVRRPGPRRPLPLNHLPGEHRQTMGRIGEDRLALNWRTKEWRPYAVPLVTRANRAPFRPHECSFKLAPQSAFTRPAIRRSQSANAGAGTHTLRTRAGPGGR